VSSRRGNGGLVIGLMFLGMGVGLLVDNPGAGVLIGLGLGFVIMAFLRGGAEERGAEVAPRPPPLPEDGRFGAVFLLGLGAIFMTLGVMLLLGVAVPWRTMGALFLVALGLGFLWWGVSALRARVG